MGRSVTKKLAVSAVDLEIAEFVETCYADPLRFVVGCYPWGEKGGPLEHHAGPDAWQRTFLTDIGEEVRAKGFNGRDPVDAVLRAVSSGHGIGKSVMVAMIVDWLMSTRPMSIGTVTANTFTQLQTKTWASIRRWTRWCLTGHWFVVTEKKMFHPAFPESWFCALQTSRESNSEAFAGQHAADSTSFYIFDEASAIARAIWEVMQGGLTDGEPFAFAFGNATRSEGEFHRNCFGSGRDTWKGRAIDSRTSRFTNKNQIAAWLKEHGEDSDFFRVRVRGLPPAASDLQFIPTTLIGGAQRRKVALLGDEPLVAGLDLSRGGHDKCVMAFRRGTDARSIPPIVIPGERARDSMRVATVAGDALHRSYDGRQVAMLFVDATGGSIGGPIADRLRQLGHKNVVDVQFGGESPDAKYHDMRSYMWGRLRDWLPIGSIDESADLESDLSGPGYLHDNRDRIVLESKESMKERGVDSPDYGDALALTFAQRVLPGAAKKPSGAYKPTSGWS